MDNSGEVATQKPILNSGQEFSVSVKKRKIGKM